MNFIRKLTNIDFLPWIQSCSLSFTCIVTLFHFRLIYKIFPSRFFFVEELKWMIATFLRVFVKSQIIYIPEYPLANSKNQVFVLYYRACHQFVKLHLQRLSFSETPVYKVVTRYFVRHKNSQEFSGYPDGTC